MPKRMPFLDGYKTHSVPGRFPPPSSSEDDVVEEVSASSQHIRPPGGEDAGEPATSPSSELSLRAGMTPAVFGRYALHIEDWYEQTKHDGVGMLRDFAALRLRVEESMRNDPDSSTLESNPQA